MEKLKNIIIKTLCWIGGFIGGVLALMLAFALFKFGIYLLLLFVTFINYMMGGGHEERHLYEFEIDAMKDNNTYVVSRYDGNSSLEYYYTRTVNGRIKTGHTDASVSTIIEDGENKVEVYVEVPEHFTGLAIKLSDWASFNDSPQEYKQFIYHIPKDSVETGEYNVDLE